MNRGGHSVFHWEGAERNTGFPDAAAGAKGRKTRAYRANPIFVEAFKLYLEIHHAKSFSL